MSANNESAWRVGGNLGIIRPSEMYPPFEPVVSPSTGLSFYGQYNDYYREGGLEKEGSSFSRGIDANAWYAVKSPLPLEISLRSNQHQWRLSLLEELSEQVMEVSHNTWQTTLFSRIAVKPFYLGTGMRANSGSETEPIASLTLDLDKHGALGILWQRKFLEPSTDVDWHEEKVGLRLEAFREELTGWLRTPEFGGISGEVLLGRHIWIRKIGNTVPTVLKPWGDENQHHAFIKYNYNNWDLLSGIRGKEYDLQAYGIQGDIPFSKITACKFNVDSWFISIHDRLDETDDLIMEYEQFRFEGSGRGHLEFWPFTSGLVDLLGSRRYFRASTNGELNRYHIGWNHNPKKGWSRALGINMLDLNLDGVTTHWRPAFLVFGVEDLQKHRLPVYRVLSGMITLSVGYSKQSWKISYTADQLIPLKIWRYGISEEGVYPEKPTETKARKYGGGFHMLYLSKLINLNS
ncbi:MAG: hypothetical protein P9L92_05200 [Candidatus Electryonea clarkiae]|nr:hypothetical protein [Candidatus Electryonea clarkiae]MDP8286895.1 hypothetical protein [Candidatus Electryonea clarkiae]